jgi:thiamine biosynthesis lipoprotein
LNGHGTRASFRALGTRISVIGVGVSARALARGQRRAQALAEDWERAFSRFRPDSELSRLNRAGGESVRVSRAFLRVLEAALDGVARTGGRFDPSVLPALEAAGYRQDLALVQAAPVSVLKSVPGRGGVLLDQVSIDRRRARVALGGGVQLDLGGIAKGAFVDRLAAELAAWPGGCVDAGGDLRVWGQSPSGSSWRIGVEDPDRLGEDLLVAEVRPGATLSVATSAANRRRWRCTDGAERHHLIDPRSGLPLPAMAPAVTVFGPAAIEVEIATKSLIVAAARGEALAVPERMMAVLAWPDGRREMIGGDYAQTSDMVVIEADGGPA